jgi:hypothetical protein
MALDEFFHRAMRGARRDYDFHASAMKYTHSEAASAAAFADDPVVRGVAVRPQGQLRRSVI